MMISHKTEFRNLISRSRIGAHRVENIDITVIIYIDDNESIDRQLILKTDIKRQMSTALDRTIHTPFRICLL